MAEDIDLRGTQGSVVLPHGTVVQNYSSEPTKTSRHHDVEEGRSADSRTIQEHSIELAVLRTEMNATRVELKELMTLNRQMELQLRQVLEWVQPRYMAGAWPGGNTTLLLVLLGVLVIFGAIYFGGHWGG